MQLGEPPFAWRCGRRPFLFQMLAGHPDDVLRLVSIQSIGTLAEDLVPPVATTADWASSGRPSVHQDHLLGRVLLCER